MRSTRWVALMMVSALGCSQTNGREGVDAAVDTREVPRDGAMEVTRESFCVGLDPLSAACAREVLARIDSDGCLDSLACASTPIDPRFCDVYNPEQGSSFVDGHRYQLVLVRLGRLRVDLDAAVCMLRGDSFCGDGWGFGCGPVLVPTADFTACTETEECGRDGYCADVDLRGCGAGVCAPRLAPGAACTVGARCTWGELCLEGLCRAPAPLRRAAPLGARCGQIADGATYYSDWCAEGLACAFGGGFSTATCIGVSRQGEPCGSCPGPDCATCGASLRCDANVCVSYELPREGEPCRSPGGSAGLCDWGTYGLLCEDGLCITNESRIGDVCRIPCVEGYCAYTDESPDVQRCLATRRPLGESCNAIDECENGLCCDGVCVPVP